MQNSFNEAMMFETSVCLPIAKSISGVIFNWTWFVDEVLGFSLSPICRHFHLLGQELSVLSATLSTGWCTFGWENGIPFNGRLPRYPYVRFVGQWKTRYGSVHAVGLTLLLVGKHASSFHAHRSVPMDYLIKATLLKVWRCYQHTMHYPTWSEYFTYISDSIYLSINPLLGCPCCSRLQKFWHRTRCIKIQRAMENTEVH